MFDIPGALHPNKDTEYRHIVNAPEKKTSLFQSVTHQAN